jgi:cell division protein ZapA (FtsZ GTPase activity inhibitor)
MLEKLRQYCRDNKADNIIVVVGYSQSYALEVHERTDVKRRVGQPKFLETAARSLESDIRNMIRRAGREKLAEAMLRAGLLIQRESQKLTPVDTSALRASAFTTTEDKLEQVSNEARTRAEQIQTKVLAQRERRGKR